MNSNEFGFLRNPFASRGVKGGSAPLLWIAAALMLATSAGGTPPATTRATTQPGEMLKSRVRKVIDQLGDENFNVRQSASLQLNSLPGPSLPIIEAALAANDLAPDTTARLEEALKILRPRASIEARRAARDAFILDAFRSAYLKGGHADPRWDADALTALEGYLKFDNDPIHGPAPLKQIVSDAVTRAFNAGCDDPLVLSVGFIVSGHSMGPQDPYVNWNGGKEHGGVQQGNYPALVKLIEAIGHLWMENLYDPSSRSLITALTKDVARTPGIPPWTLEPLTNQFLQITERDTQRWSSLKPFLKSYAEASPNSTDPLVLGALAHLGDVDQDYAREGIVNQESLSAAEALLLKAREKDPNDARPPALMISVLEYKGGGESNDADMQTWFDRAVEIDPDWREPYKRGLSYFDSTEHDGHAKMLEFGHKCLDMHNWRGGGPWVLIQAHERIARETPDREAYFRQTNVWRDCAEAYEGGLLNLPDDVKLRSQYAKLAMSCGQWLVARRQFHLLGNSPDLSVFVSKASYDYLRQKAERFSTAQPGGNERQQ